MMLMDEFLASSHTLPKRIGLTGKPKKLTDKVLADYRLQVMRSKRFVLDDEFVTMATTLSSATKPEALLSRLGSATLPYDSIWIEFDPRAKVRASNAVQGRSPDKPLHERVPEKMGLLLTRGGASSWSVVMFSNILVETYKGVQPLIGPHPVVMLFDADERDFHAGPTAGYPTWKSTMNEKGPDSDHDFDTISDDLTSMIWGYLKGGDLKEPGQLAQQTPAFLRRHGNIATSWFFESLLKYFLTHGKKDEYDNWINQYAVDLYEATGLIRWIVTVLSILNEVPTTTKHVRPTTTHIVNLTKRVEHFEHHVVTLRIPQVKKPVAWLGRQINGGGGKRRHDVASHWRNYLHHETVDLHCPVDESQVPPRRMHAWEYDNADGYRLCTKCQAFGRLIHEHQRGDIALGWVSKDYNVKGASA